MTQIDKLKEVLEVALLTRATITIETYKIIYR